MALARLLKTDVQRKAFARSFATLRPLSEVPYWDRKRYAYEYADALFGSNQVERIYGNKWYGNAKGLLDHVGGPLPLGSFLFLIAYSKEAIFFGPEMLHYMFWGFYLSLVHVALRKKSLEIIDEQSKKAIQYWDDTCDLQILLLDAIRSRLEYLVQRYHVMRDFAEYAPKCDENVWKAVEHYERLNWYEAALDILQELADKEVAEKKAVETSVVKEVIGVEEWTARAWMSTSFANRKALVDERFACLVTGETPTDPIADLVAEFDPEIELEADTERVYDEAADVQMTQQMQELVDRVAADKAAYFASYPKTDFEQFRDDLIAGKFAEEEEDDEEEEEDEAEVDEQEPPKPHS